MSRLPYTAETVERAFDIHTDANRIRSWSKLPGGRYHVRIHGAPDFELRSLREAYVFVRALASAAHAPEPAMTR